MVFGGRDSGNQIGVYLHDGSTLSRVVNEKTSIPGGVGNFSILNAPLMNDGDILFFGRGAAAADGGLYIVNNGIVSVVVDSSTPIPDGVGTFGTFLSPRNASMSGSIDEGNIAFIGRGINGQEGIHGIFDGSVEKIIDLNDLLDGIALNDLDF